MAGLGLSGCGRSRTVKPALQGERKDPNFAQGHRLRDGELPRTPKRIEKVRGVILGGGVAGLSAGWRWSHANFTDYKLLELETDPGGNSRALPYEPVSAPIGAHYLPIPNREARAVRRLLREMGYLIERDGREVLLETELCHSREERLYYQGYWYDGLVPTEALSEESRSQLDSFTEKVESFRRRRDGSGRKVFALPLAYSSREPEFLALDRISMAEYMRHNGWNDPFLNWYIEYASRDDFGGSLSDCSAWSVLHYFASRDGGGLGEAGDLLVWPEGNNRLVKHLVSCQRGRVLDRSLITRVRPRGDGVTVDYIDLARDELVRLEAEAAVWSLPSFLRPRLMEEEFPSEPFVYQPWVTVNLELDRAPQDREGPGMIAWDNVLYGSESLGYVVATHQLLDTDPLVPTVWTWYRPFPYGDAGKTREDLLVTDWEFWKETVLKELSEVHPDIRERCRRLDVTVLGHGMIRPSVGFIWGEVLEAARRPNGRLSFGHSDLSGISVFEESQFRGVKAAEETLSELGYRVESFL